jgi:hypothetical protein
MNHREAQDFHEQDNADVDPGPGAGLPTKERDYIIPAQDSHGVSVRLYCRAMPTSGRLLADVVASRKYPFRTIGDAIRWCVTYGTKRLVSGAGLQSVMAQSDAMIAALQDEEFQLMFRETFMVMKRVIESYIEAKAPDQARRVAANMRGKIESMPDGYWKKRYHDELLTQWGTLLEAGGAAMAFEDEGVADAGV